MRLSRTGLLTWLGGVAVLALRLPDVGSTVAGVGSPAFPVALRSLLDLALVGVAGWAAVALGACALGGTSAAVGRRLLPRALRGALLAGVLTGLSLGTAHAGTDTAPDQGSAVLPLDGLVLPDRPTTTDLVATSSVTAPPPREGPDQETVVLVAPGDTLWSIAATHLPANATVADVAEAVRRWHRANHDVVGADPDLIRPGQRLVLPGGAA
jgi:LysM repeat protein